MAKSEKHVPKHRAPGRHKAALSAKAKALRTGAAVGSVTAMAVGAGVASSMLGGAAPQTALADTQAPSTVAQSPEVESAEDVRALAAPGQEPAAGASTSVEDERPPVVSRSDRRGEVDGLKAARLSVNAGAAVVREESLDDGDPRDIARALLSEYGFAASEFDCLDNLYVSESNWRVDADNPSSSAYGIPQALTQTHDLPDGYMTSAQVQIRWGLEYIKGRYGTPCQAWSFKSGNGWY